MGRCISCGAPTKDSLLCPDCGGEQPLITLEELKKAQDRQRNGGGRVGLNLTKLGYIEESELTAFLSKQYGVPSINLSEFDIAPEVIDLVPHAFATERRIVPVNQAGASLIIAMADPSDIFTIDAIKELTGWNVEVVVASAESIQEAIAKYYNAS